MTLAAQGKTSAGLANLDHALTILQGLAPSTGKLTDVADTQAAIAAAYQSSAEFGKMSTSATQAAWLQARTWYEKSLETWRQIKQSGQLTAHNTVEPERIQKQITRCDSALAHMQASSGR